MTEQGRYHEDVRAGFVDVPGGNWTEPNEDDASTLIFVADGTASLRIRPGESSVDYGRRKATARAGALRTIRAYMYGGWNYVGWSSAPRETRFAGFTGFYFDGPAYGGFGADVQLDRLASGLHFGCVVPDDAGPKGTVEL